MEFSGVKGCSPYGNELSVPGLNTLRPRQNGNHFPDDIFKYIFLFENVRISIKISLKFVLKCQVNYIPVLVQIMAWRRPGDKPLSKPMMVSLLTHICVTRPQWVNQHGRRAMGWYYLKMCWYTWTPEVESHSCLLKTTWSNCISRFHV